VCLSLCVPVEQANPLSSSPFHFSFLSRLSVLSHSFDDYTLTIIVINQRIIDVTHPTDASV
jgi:hypothetical protein